MTHKPLPSPYMNNSFETILRAKPHNKYTIYWDGDNQKITTWMEQHLLAVPSAACAADGLCAENWVCTALGLSTVEMEDLNDEIGPGSPPSTAEKAKIGYVLND